MKYIFLAQIGTPKSTSIKDIRNFLKIFLKQKRVVELPKLFWYPILYCFILPFRPAKIQKKYQEMIAHLGFNPTHFYMEKLTTSFNQLLNNSFKTKTFYALEKFESEQFTAEDQIFVVPMFPQHSESTWSLIEDKLHGHFKQSIYKPSINLIEPYFANEIFINACVKQIKPHLTTDLSLILTFHSYPIARILKGDLYHDHCHQTFELIKERLPSNINITEAYHSKFGKGSWLGPSLEETIKIQREQGITNIAIFSPSFLTDSLETSHEIGIELKDKYQISLIPCLNLEWLNEFAALVDEAIKKER